MPQTSTNFNSEVNSKNSVHIAEPMGTLFKGRSQMPLSPGEARREGKAGEAAFRGKECLLFAPGPEGGAGRQEIMRRVGGAWAETWTAAGSCDESVSCKVLPARQNFASTQAAASPSGREGRRGGAGGRKHVTLS